MIRVVGKGKGPAGGSKLPASSQRRGPYNVTQRGVMVR